MANNTNNGNLLEIDPKQKIFVVDTSVFLHDPDAIEKFEDNIIVIPASVIQELDQKKAAKTKSDLTPEKSQDNSIIIGSSVRWRKE